MKLFNYFSKKNRRKRLFKKFLKLVDTSLILADTPDGILVSIKGHKIKLALLISFLLSEDKELQDLFRIVNDTEKLKKLKEEDGESKG